MSNGLRLNLSVRLLTLLALLTVGFDAHAQLSQAGVLDQVLSKYQDASATWFTEIQSHATFLFWTLATISMVWTFGMLLMKQAGLGEFFGELIKFIVTLGFFKELLTEAPSLPLQILASFMSLGATIGGTGAVSPSGIVDVGFLVLDKVLSASSVWSPVDSAVGLLIGFCVLIVLALVAVNLLLAMVNGWILVYVGIFVLGFGGSKWTSEMAITYYKRVIGLGLELLTKLLIAGVAQGLLTTYSGNIGSGVPYSDLAVMLVMAVVLLEVITKAPGMVSSLVGGGLGGGHNLGSMAAAAGMAAAAAGAAYQGAKAAASAGVDAVRSAAGGGQAIAAAYQAASAQGDSGGGSMLKEGVGSDGGDDSNSGSSSGGSPLASAMGDSGSGGSSSGGGGSSSGGGSDSGSDAGSLSDAGSDTGSSIASSSGGDGGTGGGGASTGQSSSSGNVHTKAASILASAAKDVVGDKLKGKADAVKAAFLNFGKEGTLGGEIAANIRSGGGSSSSSDVVNSFSAEANAEVAEFANKG